VGSQQRSVRSSEPGRDPAAREIAVSLFYLFYLFLFSPGHRCCEAGGGLEVGFEVLQGKRSEDLV